MARAHARMLARAERYFIFIFGFEGLRVDGLGDWDWGGLDWVA